MERGCVPRGAGSAAALSTLLRLVEDDTAALRPRANQGVGKVVGRASRLSPGAVRP